MVGGGHAPPRNLKFKSSKMVKNASKTVNSNVNFFNYYSHLKQRVKTWASCVTKI